VSDSPQIDFNNLTAASFEENLPELFASAGGKVSEDPRLADFFKANPDCAALVRDFETIAETAKSMFAEPAHDPSDEVWQKIVQGMGTPTSESDSATDLAE
jgi:hypothetical protein